MEALILQSGPWGLLAIMVLALVGLVGWGLRLVFRGKLIQAPIYMDVCGQRDSWRSVAETALAATAKHAENEGRLMASMNTMADSQREILTLVRTLVAERVKETP
jgi:hypothetical protein